MRAPLAAACVLLASMPAFALWTYGAEPLAVEAVALRSHTWLLRGQGGYQTVLAKGNRSGLLVDLLQPKERHHLIRAAEARLDGVPLRHLALTSHRKNTTGSLGEWPASAQSVAHQATAASLRRGGRPTPDLEFPGSLTIHLGGLEAGLWHKGAAHTGGASMVYLAEDQVLAVGELVTPGRHPEVQPSDNGSLRQWIQVLKQLIRDFQSNETLLVVPAQGGYGGLEMLREQLVYLETIAARVDAAWRNGLSLDELLARATPLKERLGTRRGSLAPFLRWAYAELGR